MKAVLSMLTVATSLVTTLAQAGVGDLDPSFANNGRLNPIPRAAGVARAVELSDAHDILVGGGQMSFYRVWETGRPYCALRLNSFASKLGRNGAVDSSFEDEKLHSVVTYALARHADGGVVMAGLKITAADPLCNLSTSLAVHRLADDGSLDLSFGTDGVFEWTTLGNSAASSLALEPDGRIVVAGYSDGGLAVLRLLPNGELDRTFGASGVYVDPVNRHAGTIVRTHTGAYRISVALGDGCAILGLTAAGVLDAAYGDAGFASVSSARGHPVTCRSLALLANDRLMIAGQDPEGVHLSRLLANGKPDPTFVADAAMADSMSDATAVAVGNGKVLVAGQGPNGASIMRFLISGERDTSFGDDGCTWIDLYSTAASMPVVLDMAVKRDGSVIAVGSGAEAGPFVVRLIGDKGGLGPGVVGFAENYVSLVESDDRATLRLRRRGGSDGAVSVKYRTQAKAEATSGEDFRAKSGILQWADGDNSEREIYVDLVRDVGLPEGPESLYVGLVDAQGGAGIGTRRATVAIGADGSPGGQVGFSGVTETTREGRAARFQLARNYYDSGHICVTLTPKSGTAIAGADFDADASIVCWDDGDRRPKLVSVQIVDDNRREDQETFTIELSKPTGGALIGWLRKVTVSIAAND